MASSEDYETLRRKYEAAQAQVRALTGQLTKYEALQANVMKKQRTFFDNSDGSAQFSPS
jgi:hypothetical protein